MKRYVLFFRCLVVGDWLLIVLGLPFVMLVETVLPPVSDRKEAQLLDELAGSGGLLDPSFYPNTEAGEVIALVMLLLVLGTLLLPWIAASIGLFFFQNWARWLYAGICLFALGVTLVMGLSISGPLSNLFSELSIYIQAAILCLAFFSPLRRKFRPGSAARPR